MSFSIASTLKSQFSSFVTGILLCSCGVAVVGCDKPSKKRTGADVETAAVGAQAVTEQFPPLSSLRKLTGGIDYYSIRINGSGPGRPMTLNLYFPAGRHDEKSLPCVFIAPAGTANHGSLLSDSDRAEHYPYVRAGFAVVAYELSGAPTDISERARSYSQARGPIQEFMQADGGLVNGRTAIDYVLQQVSRVDPAQLFACGHSSAADIALNLARGDSRIRACCAYAPQTDVVKWWNDPGMERFVPGYNDFAARKSPLLHASEFRCPVYLFHADDDSDVSLADNVAFDAAMRKDGRQITFDRVPTGGHYDSMIRQGVPRGIKFMESQGATPLPPIVKPPNQSNDAGAQ